MRYRALGKTGLQVSEIGFGTWAIGGSGYGPTDDTESSLTLNKALDNGINLIDTADSYGNGHSEKLIGKVLHDRDDSDTFICSKFGWDIYNKEGIRSNLGKDYIFFAVEQSLKRLNREKIDIYLIHSQNPRNIIDYEVHSTLELLKSEGKIISYGLSVSHFYTEDYISLINDTNWDVIELKFNLLDISAKYQFFDLCSNKDIGLIVREPLANGILTGKYSKSSSFDKKDHRNGWSQNYLETLIDGVENIKYRLNISNNELVKTSFSYILSHNIVSSVVSGMKNLDQLTENIEAIDYKINETIISRIEQI